MAAAAAAAGGVPPAAAAAMSAQLLRLQSAQALQAQVDSEQNAHEALLLLQANYRAGLVAYVDVLTADVQFHTASIAKLQGVAQRYQDTVGLFVALGGGWWNQPAAKAHAPSP